MALLQEVEKRMGESVTSLLDRNAHTGKSLRHCSMLMDVSYSTANRWAHQHGVKFNANNPFRTWRYK